MGVAIVGLIVVIIAMFSIRSYARRLAYGGYGFSADKVKS